MQVDLWQQKLGEDSSQWILDVEDLKEVKIGHRPRRLSFTICHWVGGHPSSLKLIATRMRKHLADLSASTLEEKGVEAVKTLSLNITWLNKRLKRHNQKLIGIWSFFLNLEPLKQDNLKYFISSRQPLPWYRVRDAFDRHLWPLLSQRDLKNIRFCSQELRDIVHRVPFQRLRVPNSAKREEVIEKLEEIGQVIALDLLSAAQLSFADVVAAISHLSCQKLIELSFLQMGAINDLLNPQTHLKKLFIKVQDSQSQLDLPQGLLQVENMRLEVNRATSKVVLQSQQFFSQLQELKITESLLNAPAWNLLLKGASHLKRLELEGKVVAERVSIDWEGRDLQRLEELTLSLDAYEENGTLPQAILQRATHLKVLKIEVASIVALRRFLLCSYSFKTTLVWLDLSRRAPYSAQSCPSSNLLKFSRDFFSLIAFSYPHLRELNVKGWGRGISYSQLPDLCEGCPDLREVGLEEELVSPLLLSCLPSTP
ncbi:MAG: hypothetical protein K0S07_769 [Chlamydiales bacterium]|jgi:hypothetical protein|nr:hypothetical protein [Chlamydiales bacterium]